MKTTLISRSIFMVVIGSLFANPGTALADRDILVRPHVGSGTAKSDNNGKEGPHTYGGMRVLLSANATQRYGLELTHIDIDTDDDSATRYVAAGIVLEQRRWRGFSMAIGTVGYFGVGDNTSNPFGLVTHLGWEFNTDGRYQPLLALRSDMIWDEPRTRLVALKLGVSFPF